MYDKKDNHLKTFDTCKSAAQYVGTDSKTIIKVCNGYRNYKSAKGYKWKYIQLFEVKDLAHWGL